MVLNHAEIDPFSPEGGYYECLDCGRRTTSDERLTVCNECGGRLTNIGVPRE